MMSQSDAHWSEKIAGLIGLIDTLINRRDNAVWALSSMPEMKLRTY